MNLSIGRGTIFSRKNIEDRFLVGRFYWIFKSNDQSNLWSGDTILFPGKIDLVRDTLCFVNVSRVFLFVYKVNSIYLFNTTPRLNRIGPFLVQGTVSV